MAAGPPSVSRAKMVNLRGKTGSQFMIDAAHRVAEDALLDQTLVRVDEGIYRHYLAILDGLTGGEGLARLINAPKPWQS